MILEDFVMLGKTVPEPNSDGRVFVCSAGWSSDLRSLVRIYPLAQHGTPARWSINKVQVAPNPKDSRRESWRLAADRTIGAHAGINACFERVGTVPPDGRSDLLHKATITSIAAANDRRLSLGILHPKACELFFEHNPDSPNSPELRLFDLDPRPTVGAKRFAYIPRLAFTDDDGDHRLMLRDWGCFEFMRKHGDDRRHELTEALHLSPNSSLLVGNLNNQRNAWLVISVLNGLHNQLSLFTESAA